MSDLRALLIEDSEDDALLVARHLEKYGLDVDGHRVDTEQQLREALADGQWDFAILDYNMPGFSGLDALHVLQETDFQGPMITVSGTIGEETAVEVMRAGAHDYVMKDNLPRLGPAIERELREAEGRRRRRETEEALRDSEERYRTLVETMGDGLTMIDLSHTITYANQAFADMVGWDVDELIGMYLEELYAPDSQTRIAEQLAQRFSRGVSSEYEETLQSRCGEQIPVLVHATALTNDEGEVTGSQAVIKDITERKRAEQRIRESEERLRALFEASPDGIIALDPDGRVTDCNPAVMQALAVESEEQIIGRSALDFVAEDAADQFRRDVKHVLEGQTSRSLHYEMVGLDGRRFPVEASANAITDEDGNPVSVVATVKDITERREAERELQQLDQFRRSIIDQANIWIHVLDRQLQPVLWNPAAAEISGVPAEEALGSDVSWDVMYPDPEDHAEMHRVATEIIEDGRVLANYNTTIATRDGEQRIISWNARQLLDQDGEPLGLLAVGRDVTEHNQLEEQLRQAAKMEAVGRLAGGIAHDFNNMLTAILANVQLISMQMDRDDEQRQLLEEVQVAARRSADLTRQLLAFSRKQTMEPENVDLNALINRFEPMLERVIGEQISVLTNLDSDLGMTRADSSQITQVLMNLVVNARDAMPEGGTLTVETSNAQLDETYAESHADVEPGQYVMLSVSDTGVGMEQDVQEHIFEPFFTTRGEEEGTGLGLATVYGIVNQSEGHIHVYSEPGSGSVFKVYLPRLVSDETADEGGSDTGEENLTGRETVLLVEDEDIVRGLIESVLGRHGHTVIAAASGEDALAMFEGRQGEIDIVVTDVVMPGMNGGELAAAVREQRPDLPVLFISGYTDNHAIHRDVDADETHYLNKPFAPEKLLRRIRQILGDGE